MALTDEETRALAWQAQQRARRAAEIVRARQRAGSVTALRTLEENWKPLIESANRIERQEFNGKAR